LLQAFLQRVVNGGGYIDREYGLGRKRTDLLIRKPLTDGYGGPIQYIVLELKIKRGEQEATIAKGLEQTSEYMDRCPADTEGHFILFNRDKGVAWDDKIWHRKETYHGRLITVWGMSRSVNIVLLALTFTPASTESVEAGVFIGSLSYHPVASRHPSSRGGGEWRYHQAFVRYEMKKDKERNNI
jgi:hypothetical protein